MGPPPTTRAPPSSSPPSKRKAIAYSVSNACLCSSGYHVHSHYIRTRVCVCTLCCYRVYFLLCASASVTHLGNAGVPPSSCSMVMMLSIRQLRPLTNQTRDVMLPCRKRRRGRSSSSWIDTSERGGIALVPPRMGRKQLKGRRRRRDPLLTHVQAFFGTFFSPLSKTKAGHFVQEGRLP